MTPVARSTSALSIRRLRTYILIALIAGVAIFTAVMFTLVQSLSERFGPQVAADLEWRALRGAQELSYKADLGLAVSDQSMVQETFGPYATSLDVQAIVALDAHGKVVATHGAFASIDRVLAAKPGTLVSGDGYVASWASASIEGNEVGRIAVVVSTRRLTEAQAVLSRVSDTTLIAGLTGALLGALVILFFTRAVSVRDRQLGDYAKNLEAKVEARTREIDERNRGMRLVLDNVAQGFITIDLDGVMAAERSAIVERWFGEVDPGMTFAAVIRRHAPDVATWFVLGLDSVREAALPLELCLDQMPKRFNVGPKTFAVAYSPILHGETVERILVIVSDITEHIIRERAEREQRELVILFQRISSDRAGFEQFFDEAAGLVGSLASVGERVVEARTLHTLKGNCAIYGFESYAALCHEIETQLDDSGEPLDGPQRRALIDAWQKLVDQMAQLLGERRRDVVEVELPELARVVSRANQGMPAHELAAILTSWSREPISRRFERLAHSATALASRLGKADPEIEISTAGIRLDEQRWSAFWSAMIHAVRNSIDHGFETAERRALAGKSPRPRLAFSAERSAGFLMIDMSDDGGGVDWTLVRERALRAGLEITSQADLERALFADGFSTRDEATETSGRGVGMAALRTAVTALGGTIKVDSSPQGTTLRFRFPDADALVDARSASVQPRVVAV
jgi:two-component system, chemotaxis family, sensor kinase CheA